MHSVNPSNRGCRSDLDCATNKQTFQARALDPRPEQRHGGKAPWERFTFKIVRSTFCSISRCVIKSENFLHVSRCDIGLQTFGRLFVMQARRQRGNISRLGRMPGI
jgi:hypothetical protein